MNSEALSAKVIILIRSTLPFGSFEENTDLSFEAAGKPFWAWLVKRAKKGAVQID